MTAGRGSRSRPPSSPSKKSPALPFGYFFFFAAASPAGTSICAFWIVPE